jgi:DHA1 family bicyclomycin/chloramphenicol resistance-like MFS transporter
MDLAGIDTDVSVEPVPSRAKMIVVLGLLVALGPLTIDMYLPALPRIADELSVSSSVAQLTLTGTLAGLALGQLW